MCSALTKVEVVVCQCHYSRCPTDLCLSPLIPVKLSVCLYEHDCCFLRHGLFSTNLFLLLFIRSGRNSCLTLSLSSLERMYTNLVVFFLMLASVL